MQNLYKTKNNFPAIGTNAVGRYILALTLLLTVGFNFISYDILAQAVSAGVAPSTPPLGGFGIEGDLRANFPTPGIYSAAGDWLGNPGDTKGVLYSAAGAGHAAGDPIVPATTFHVVDSYLSGDNVFDGGQKKNDDLTKMKWGSGNPSPAKCDINNFTVHIARDANDDTWITLSGDREKTDGNSFISIALLQKILTLGNTGNFVSGAPSSTGGRTPGDVQVSAEFTDGGANPNLYLEEWKLINGVYQWSPLVIQQPLPPAPPIVYAYGSTNTAIITGMPYDVFNGKDNDPSNDFTYPVNSFIEVSFNISEIYRNASTPCVGSIASMFVMTKSSQSVSANLTDFVAPIQINLDINVGPPTAIGATYCAGQAIANLAASGESGATFKWYTALDNQGKPTGTATTGSPFNPNINNSIAGVYNFYVTQTIRGCESQHTTVTVTVNANPVLSITNPAAVCAPNTVDITAAAVTAGSTLAGATLTYFQSDGVTPITALAAQTLGAGTYKIKATTNTTPACSDMEEVVVTVNPTPVLSITNPDGVCAPNTVDITVAAITAGSTLPNGTTLTYFQSDGVTPITALAAQTLGPGTYKIKATTNATPACSDIETVTVSVKEKPARPVVTITEATLCGSLLAPKLEVNCPVAGIYTLTQTGVQGSKTFNYTGSNGPVVFENLVAGKQFSITLTIDGCVSDPTHCDNKSNLCPPPPTRQAAINLPNSIGNTNMFAYPVPFSEKVTIQFTAETDENYVVNLYDLQGKLIRELKSGNATAGEVITIEVSGEGMRESMYLARKVSKSGISTIKLLKKE